jgi:ATP phosphoribosyltransferase regulatory subunit
LGGGRYDGLFAGFGAPLPATGFAIRVDRVLASTPGREEPGAEVAVAFTDGDRAGALRLARALRARDIAVTVELLARPWEEAARQAITAGAARAVLVTGGRARVRGADGQEHLLPLDEVPDWDPGNGARPWRS